MFMSLVQGLLHTQTEFLVMAAFVCAAMAVTLVILMRNVAVTEGQARLAPLAWITVVAGLGVWTTHFIVMVGYRPAASVSYAPGTTAISALVGILFVGLPLAAACLLRRRWSRAVLGAVAGAGVGAMHFTGMMAMQSPMHHQSDTSLVAILLGMVFFAPAMAVRGVSRRARWLRGTAFVAGVCSLHFTAMSGLSVMVIGQGVFGIDRRILSIFTGLAALGLCYAAMTAMANRHRLMTAQKAIERKDASFLAALQNMSNALIMIDADRVITAINQRSYELFAIEESDVGAGDTLDHLLDAIGRQRNWESERLASTIETHLKRLSKNAMLRDEEEFANGKVLCISSRKVPGGEVVITFDDFTEHRAAQAKIAHMAFHDALTGLPNRRSFRDHMATLNPARHQRALLMIDLDHFKVVNDTLGHPVGDGLLVQVARRLLDAAGSSATVFRLGGDELVAVLNGAGEVEALETGRNIIESIGAPYDVDGHTITIGCSIGASLTGDGIGASEALQRADLGLYRAKNLGRNRIQFYEDGMMEQALERRQMESDLAQALKCEEFELDYQPIFRLSDRSILGFEALIRWHHPVRGLISPADFIPLSEENGMIIQIGEWVINEACRQLSEWSTDIHIAINVSPLQMRLPSIVEVVRKALERHGLAATRLTLELTETALVRDGAHLARNLIALRGMGVKIAMDDFGTGYSSFTHLRDFELDQIKIDRSFINVSQTDHKAWAVAQAVTNMARELSVGAVGEGVETSEQITRLMQLGCDVAQGFHLGRPVNGEKASRLLADAQTAAREVFLGKENVAAE
ncbi:bifunctional diguanylate cyclase/phosphodiesterase [Limimaricola cinnabarinus]|uniref:Sensory box/GGDEF family protein n=1 Tax=Limimaricola cinnabarinus LL-001 TaxID=1337093 RepID=U3AID6_9RHOB|nr:EAL domain-containing protein [Limimaricola cinnabarinus]GAD54563.1 sensory box/GGDEF family protein [Limimaricola cinnabarinus LL-001]